MMTDPIADMLTRIRNANAKRYENVSMNASNMKKNIAEVMKQEGFIQDYEVVGEGVEKTLNVRLKYKSGEAVISGLKRISRPGLRVYRGKSEIPRVMGGMGVAIMSTPKGVIAGKKARQENVGGEVLCYIW